ncbi:hypothetical protein C6558_21010 [Ensifer sp. NM-2]|nr:hypothetical protein C6558_21010 [Ensifer sp. NM-2]
MISKSAVMKEAWVQYRLALAENAKRFTPYENCTFGECLRLTWQAMKRAAKRSGPVVPAANVERVTRLRQEIENLNYRPFRMPIAAERAALEAEINTLSA